MLRIRLKRTGSRNQPSYRIVVADSKKPRDGKFVEQIGHYNPRQDPPEVVIDREKAGQERGTAFGSCSAHDRSIN